MIAISKPGRVTDKLRPATRRLKRVPSGRSLTHSYSIRLPRRNPFNPLKKKAKASPYSIRKRHFFLSHFEPPSLQRRSCNSE